jgi:hypothetical protein
MECNRSRGSRERELVGRRKEEMGGDGWIKEMPRLFSCKWHASCEIGRWGVEEGGAEEAGFI